MDAPSPTFFVHAPSPLGPLMIVADDRAVLGAWFVGQRHFPKHAGEWLERPDSPLLVATAKQFAEYFAGTRRDFTLPLAPAGTPFQKQVWSELERIPFGSVTTYGAIASRLGRPKSVRAVGAAVGRNPLSIIIPCHRVLGSNGALTGYAGGLGRKQALLTQEGAAHYVWPEDRAAGPIERSSRF